jgi:hypothetical protein
MAGQETWEWRVLLIDGERHIAPAGAQFEIHESGALLMLSPEDANRPLAVFAPGQWEGILRSDLAWTDEGPDDA